MRAGTTAWLAAAVAALLLCTGACTLVTGVIDGLFGSDPVETQEAEGVDPVLREPIRDAQGRFDPALVLDREDEPLLAADSAPRENERDLPEPVEREPDAPVADDQAEKKAQARNPPPEDPGAGEKPEGERLDLLFEILALAAFAALAALVIALARRHTAGFAAVVSVCALGVAVLAWLT